MMLGTLHVYFETPPKWLAVALVSGLGLRSETCRMGNILHEKIILGGGSKVAENWKDAFGVHSVAKFARFLAG